MAAEGDEVEATLFSSVSDSASAVSVNVLRGPRGGGRGGGRRRGAESGGARGARRRRLRSPSCRREPAGGARARARGAGGRGCGGHHAARAPDVGRDALVWVVHQLRRLQLVEGAVREVLAHQPPRHPLAPAQREARLVVALDDEDGDAHREAAEVAHQLGAGWGGGRGGGAGGGGGGGGGGVEPSQSGRTPPRAARQPAPAPPPPRRQRAPRGGGAARGGKAPRARAAAAPRAPAFGTRRRRAPTAR